MRRMVLDRPGGRALALAILLALQLGAPRGDAAEPRRDPAGAIPLTADAIQARIDRLPKEPQLNDEQRGRVRARLDAALESVREAESWRARGQQLEIDRSAARALAADSRQRAASLAAEPVADPPPHATLDELNALLEQAESDLSAAQTRLGEAESGLEERTRWRRESPARIVELRARIPELDRQLALPPPPGELAALTDARALALRAERLAAEAELAVRQADADAREVLMGRLRAQKDEAAAEVERLRRNVDRVKTARLQWRRRDADAAALEAHAVVLAAGPLTRVLAEDNERLAALRSGPEGLAARIEQVSADTEQIRQEQEAIKTEFADVQARVARLGTTDAVGLMLQKKVRELPAIGATRASLRTRKEEIRDTELSLLDLSEQRATLAKDLDQAVVGALGANASDPQARAEARRLLDARLKYLAAATRDLNRLFNALVEIDGSERELLAAIAQYRAFLDERVLWVPVAGMLGTNAPADAWSGARWLLDPRAWVDALFATARFTADHWPVALPLLLLAALLLAARRALVRRLEAASARIATTSAPWTAAALAFAWTALLAARWPLVFWIVSWLCAAPADAPPVAVAVGWGLTRLMNPLLWIQLTRWLCWPGGAGRHALGWSDAKIATVRETMVLLARFVVPSVLLANSWYAHYRSFGPQWAETSGRIAYLAAMVFLALAGWRLANPREAALSRHGGRLRKLGIVAVVVAPLILGGLAIGGYIHTSLRLTGAVFWSAWLVAGARAVVGLARHLPRGRAIDAHAAEAAEQLLRLLRSVAVIGVLVGLWYLWADLVPALGILRTIDLWTVETPDGVRSVTLASVLLSLLIVVTTFGIARNLRGLLRAILPDTLHVDAGVGYAVASLIRYAFLVVGTIAALGTIGISWARAQWLVAGLSVGLGFGLQEMFANLVAGLTVLFERSVRVGDIVTIGGVDGEVTRIRIRATTLQAFDLKELVIPNRELVTTTVTNWTLTDSVARMQFPVGVEYGSDTAAVERILLKIAAQDTEVLRAPPPRVVLEQLGENALSFRLFLFVAERRRFPDVLHRVNVAIDKELREAGIRIAFPQRDLRLASTTPVDVRVVPSEPR